jgi:hypothetical protein
MTGFYVARKQRAMKQKSGDRIQESECQETTDNTDRTDERQKTLTTKHAKIREKRRNIPL